MMKRAFELQQAYKELYNSSRDFVSITEDYIHITYSLFLELYDEYTIEHENDLKESYVRLSTTDQGHKVIALVLKEEWEDAKQNIQRD